MELVSVMLMLKPLLKLINSIKLSVVQQVESLDVTEDMGSQYRKFIKLAYLA